MYRLTNEGKNYLQKGFPEKRLIVLLKNGRKYTKDLSIDRKDEALYWAKKNRWIAVDDNSAILTFFGRMALSFPKTGAEEALSDVEKKGLCNEKYARELVGRKLIEEAGKDNLTLKLKNMFWKNGEFEDKSKYLRPVYREISELKKRIRGQQKAIDYLQAYSRNLEKRLRNVEQRG